MPCPLCSTPSPSLFFEDSRRPYFQCQTCGLIFVPSAHYLSPHEEKARYDTHQNDPHDPGYRRFLARLQVPLVQLLERDKHQAWSRELGPRGLDFGSGPGPTLSVMLEESGCTMSLFDRFYANDPSVLQESYDFITATEVVEHLHEPGRECDRLWGCLKPGGYLGIMTKRAGDRKAFATWHYIRDLTHVCFFSRATFVWLARRWSASVRFIGNDVVILQKNA